MAISHHPPCLPPSRTAPRPQLRKESFSPSSFSRDHARKRERKRDLDFIANGRRLRLQVAPDYHQPPSTTEKEDSVVWTSSSPLKKGEGWGVAGPFLLPFLRASFPAVKEEGGRPNEVMTKPSCCRRKDSLSFSLSSSSFVVGDVV